MILLEETSIDRHHVVNDTLNNLRLALSIIHGIETIEVESNQGYEASSTHVCRIIFSSATEDIKALGHNHHCIVHNIHFFASSFAEGGEGWIVVLPVLVDVISVLRKLC